MDIKKGNAMPVALQNQGSALESGGGGTPRGPGGLEGTPQQWN